ncbi:hypothetical protein Tco_1347921 [Tanacetum coccineum]
MVGCLFRNVKKVEESVALKELRLNTLSRLQCNGLACMLFSELETIKDDVKDSVTWPVRIAILILAGDYSWSNGIVLYLEVSMLIVLLLNHLSGKEDCTEEQNFIEGWEKGVASTDVFGVPLEVTVLRQDSTKPVLFILVKCADFLVLSGMIRGGKMDWYRVLEF